MLLSAEHIYKDYGTKKLLSDETLYLNERDRIGIIGVNGTGKSTLLRLLALAEAPDDGSVAIARNARISFLTQEPKMDDERSVLEQAFAEQSDEFAEINEYEMKTMLTKLGISDFSAKVGTLSGGQKKRVALAAALIRPADILILDEPTNHLDSGMVIWLEEKLKKFTGGLIMVTHDRYLLENVANRITELFRAKLYSYEANYSKYLAQKAERADMEAASERKRQSLLRREYEWISRSARARSTKSKDRIERYNELVELESAESARTVEISAAKSRMGKKLIELYGITKSFGGKRVIDDFSYNIKRDDRIGIIGKNGAGKSTLLNIIAQRLTPDAGTVEIGSTMRIGYFMQENRELNEDERVYDFIRSVASEVKTDEGTFSISQMLERFLFDSTMQYARIGSLSGGERRRLYLLSILAAAPNVLLLDEPTNDLDIETLTVLEDYLESFPGALIAVSHDRYFLDKTASSIFEVGGDGKITAYSGNFSDYLAKRPVQVNDKPAESAQVKPAREKRENPNQKLKMTFREEREFESIDGDIAALEANIAKCEKELMLAASEYVKVMELTAKLDGLKKELDDKTERWVYLSELAEKIAMQQQN